MLGALGACSRVARSWRRSRLGPRNPALCQTATPGAADRRYRARAATGNPARCLSIWAWLLQNEFPFVSVVEALLVSFDVEFPVGVEVA